MIDSFPMLVVVPALAERKWDTPTDNFACDADADRAFHRVRGPLKAGVPGDAYGVPNGTGLCPDGLCGGWEDRGDEIQAFCRVCGNDEAASQLAETAEWATAMMKQCPSL